MKLNKMVLTLLLAFSMTLVVNASNEGRTYTVKQDGTGDFTTIQEGVNTVESGSTLEIYEGTYDEQVQILNKTVNLVGVDREKCILQHNNDRYMEIPLEISVGVVSNLTIYGYTSHTGDWINNPVKPSQEYIDSFNSDDEKRAAGYSGYAVHIEQDYLENKSLLFDNCTIISDRNQTIGAGLRSNCTLSFDNCELISNGRSGVFFGHDWASDDSYGESILNFSNCIMRCYCSPYFFNLSSLHDSNKVNLRLSNNKVYATMYSVCSTYDNNRYNGFNAFDMIISNSSKLHMMDSISVDNLLANVLNSSYKPDEDLIQEGITMLDMGFDIKACEGFFPVQIINDDEECRSDGWCGSSCFYLTPDSGGNTLDQMNYDCNVNERADYQSALSLYIFIFLRRFLGYEF